MDRAPTKKRVLSALLAERYTHLDPQTGRVALAGAHTRVTAQFGGALLHRTDVEGEGESAHTEVHANVEMGHRHALPPY
jgi:hypothetical protein